MAANTKNFTISNLIPNEDYAMQVRAVDNGDSSVWSNKKNFKTINDMQQGGAGSGAPSPVSETTLLDWYTGVGGFTAVWTAVTSYFGGMPFVIHHYDMEMVDDKTGLTKIFEFYTNQKPTVSITLQLDTMKSFFGGMPGNVTLRVRAVANTGNYSEWSNALTCSMGTPDPPTNAVVVEIVDGLKVSWTPPVNKAFLDGYNMYVSTNPAFVPGPGNLVYHGAAPSATFNSATYVLHYIKISSYNDAGTESTFLPATGTPKSPFTIDVVPPAVPGLSGNLSAGGVTPRFAELTWTFNAGTPGNEDIAGFVVAWRKVGASTWGQAFFSPELRTGTIELPQPYADYEFKIASYDKVGNYSAYSTLLSLGGAIPGAPAQVTGVTSTASLDALNLAWNANTEGDVVNGGVYNVDIATNSGFTTGLQNYTTGATSISINALLPGTTYYYRVRAVDVGGTAGIYSTTDSRLTPDYAPTKSDGAAPSSSPTPSIVEGVGFFTAQWARITNNDLVTYEVHLSTTTGFTPNAGTLLAETTATSIVVRTLVNKVTPLSYGTNYYVKIIAKDADGAAAAGTQALGRALQATNTDIADVSFGKVTAGTLTSNSLVLGAGGIFRTNNSDVIITDTGITVGANSQISAAAMQAGTAFVDDLTISSNFTIGTSGVMKSANYAPGTTGWQLTNNTFDFRSGTISAGTLVAGTITSTGISIGAGGGLTIDSTGYIQSNNYAVNSTGWKISSTGIEMNDANSSIKANAIKTGTISSAVITIGTNTVAGEIKSWDYNGTSVGWSISNTGLNMFTGTIKGAAVYTNQLASLTTDPNSPLPPIPGAAAGASFGINAAGKAVFSGALIYGTTVIGTVGSTSHLLQSANWSPGSQGWYIRGDGYAEFSQMAIYGSATLGGTLSSLTPGWALYNNGSAVFNQANMIVGNQASGPIWLVNNGNGQIRFYLPGGVPGSSTYFHHLSAGVNGWGYAYFQMRGAGGGAVELHDKYNVAYVGWQDNCVYIGENANVGGRFYVNGNIRAQGPIDTAASMYCGGAMVVENGITVNGGINAGQINGSGGQFPQLTNSGTFWGDPVLAWMIGSGNARYTYVGDGGHLSRGAQVSSSIRYKKNVRDLTYTKEQILSLRPVHYQNKFMEPQDEPQYAGFIAEEVAEAGLDDFVIYGRVDEEGNEKEPVIETFDYNHFTAALLKVAQEQQAEIDDLRSRLEALEA